MKPFTCKECHYHGQQIDATHASELLSEDETAAPETSLIATSPKHKAKQISEVSTVDVIHSNSIDSTQTPSVNLVTPKRAGGSSSSSSKRLAAAKKPRRVRRKAATVKKRYSIHARR